MTSAVTAASAATGPVWASSAATARARARASSFSAIPPRHVPAAPITSHAHAPHVSARPASRTARPAAPAASAFVSASAAAAAAADAPEAPATAGSTAPSRPAASQRRKEHDPYYGFKSIALLCERFVNILFDCPLSSPDGTTLRVGAGQKPAPRLAEFVAYALYRTRLPSQVTYQTLYLLKRLKQHYPAARGSAGHPLFLSALMLASKAVCDDTYSNKSWTIVGQGLFALPEVNHMERELLGFLNFKVNVAADELERFTHTLNDPSVHLEQYIYLACVAPRSPADAAEPFGRCRLPPTPSDNDTQRHAHHVGKQQSSSSPPTGPTIGPIQPVRTYSAPGLGPQPLYAPRPARSLTVGTNHAYPAPPMVSAAAAAAAAATAPSLAPVSVAPTRTRPPSIVIPSPSCAPSLAASRASVSASTSASALASSGEYSFSMGPSPSARAVPRLSYSSTSASPTHLAHSLTSPVLLTPHSAGHQAHLPPGTRAMAPTSANAKADPAVVYPLALPGEERYKWA